ncbi:hypothetical protein CYMTET_31214 [Cymbomonas tetramitiformis]|uniref:Uncharacterized protein n=1 Tax=Cymbomonas tetramitiformis TaxID=36881 RepID=A0AAE0FH88_9CHLO|nr:hypothetical protein CYMTET_31214 [Cymbomonas tetramitiformis]
MVDVEAELARMKTRKEQDKFLREQIKRYKDHAAFQQRVTKEDASHFRVSGLKVEQLKDMLRKCIDICTTVRMTAEQQEQYQNQWKQHLELLAQTQRLHFTTEQRRTLKCQQDQYARLVEATNTLCAKEQNTKMAHEATLRSAHWDVLEVFNDEDRARGPQLNEKLQVLQEKFGLEPTFNYGMRGMVGDCLYLSWLQCMGKLPSLSMAEIAKSPPQAFREANRELRGVVARALRDESEKGRALLELLALSTSEREALIQQRVKRPGTYANDDVILTLSVEMRRVVVVLNADSEKKNAPVVLYLPWPLPNRRGTAYALSSPRLYSWQSFLKWLDLFLKSSNHKPIILKYTGNFQKVGTSEHYEAVVEIPVQRGQHENRGTLIRKRDDLPSDISSMSKRMKRAANMVEAARQAS